MTDHPTPLATLLDEVDARYAQRGVSPAAYESFQEAALYAYPQLREELRRLSEADDEAARLRAELMRRWPCGTPPCGGCGGPHPYDTSIPSPLWNAVIRAAGLSDYLCTTCIVAAFVKAGQSFEAELYGGSDESPVDKGSDVATIHVQVGTRPMTDSYGDLNYENRQLRATLERRTAALEPFAKFAEQWNRKPIKTIGDDVYTIHTGTEYEASLRRSDCEQARAALVEPAGEQST